MVPGVLAMLLLVVTALLSSMAIVRERELGTLEQLNVMPLTRWELIVGKLLPYGIIALVDAAMVVSVAVFWFEVPFEGSVLTLLGRDPGLPAVHAGPGLLRVDDGLDAAAGHADGDLLLPDADDLPVRLHVPDREHAARDPVADVR